MPSSYNDGIFEKWVIPNGFRERRGYPVVVQPSAACHNRADAQRLWQLSEELTGVNYLEPALP